jgi:hypothetical protein
MENYGTGVVPVMDLNANRNDGCYGDGGYMWFWIIILFALWGNNGFGNNGNGVADIMASNFGRGVASPQDVADTVSQSNMENQVRGVQQGLCDGFYAMNTSLLNGFNGVDSAISTLGYQNQNAIQQLSSQLADCCCENKTAIMQAQFDNQMAVNNLSTQVGSGFCGVENAIANQNMLNAQNTNAIIQASNDNTRAILDRMCQQEIQQLRDQNQAYLNQISQNAQTTSILDALLPVAKPAYLTLSPYQTAIYPYNTLNGGCGCGNSFI